MQVFLLVLGHSWLFRFASAKAGEAFLKGKTWNKESDSWAGYKSFLVLLLLLLLGYYCPLLVV